MRTRVHAHKHTSPRACAHESARLRNAHRTAGLCRTTGQPREGEAAVLWCRWISCRLPHALLLLSTNIYVCRNFPPINHMPKSTVRCTRNIPKKRTSACKETLSSIKTYKYSQREKTAHIVKDQSTSSKIIHPLHDVSIKGIIDEAMQLTYLFH